jgi:hypothetical protein
MVKIAMDGNRMEDFYDVYLSHNFLSIRVRKTIGSNFQKGKIPIPNNPLIFRAEFYENK